MISILKALKIILWLSPIAKLIAQTVDAVSDGYYEGLIKDPGHAMIKWFDRLVILITWITVIAICFPSMIHYVDLYRDDTIGILLTFFFPYFFNIQISILFYVASIILFTYNKYRKNIIRRINEKKGVW